MTGHTARSSCLPSTLTAIVRIPVLPPDLHWQLLKMAVVVDVHYAINPETPGGSGESHRSGSPASATGDGISTTKLMENSQPGTVCCRIMTMVFRYCPPMEHSHHDRPILHYTPILIGIGLVLIASSQQRNGPGQTQTRSKNSGSC